MSALQLLSFPLVALGACFFAVGAVGLVRFPDALSRLHAVSKAASVGMGFTVMGLLPRAGSVVLALKLLFFWALVWVASATVGQLVARSAVRNERRR